MGYDGLWLYDILYVDTVGRQEHHLNPLSGTARMPLLHGPLLFRRFSGEMDGRSGPSRIDFYLES